MEDGSVSLSEFTPCPAAGPERPEQRDSADGRWWLRNKPHPTPDEARAELAAYAVAVNQMEEAARAEQEAIRRASEAADKVEYEFLRMVAADYAAGKLSQLDLADIYYSYRILARPAYYQRWDALIPFLSNEITTGRFNEPNADGGWSGPWPLNRYGQSVPRDGQAVVYVLTDADGVDCYIGSTEKMRQRLKWHVSDGKKFVAWRATPYQSRQAAYDAEVELLRKGLPYLNQRCGR